MESPPVTTNQHAIVTRGMASHGRKLGIIRANWGRNNGGGRALLRYIGVTGGEKMNEDVFNASIRKFLKTLGVSAQREIEKALREALANGKLKGTETLPTRAMVTIAGIDLVYEIKGEVELE